MKTLLKILLASATAAVAFFYGGLWSAFHKTGSEVGPIGLVVLAACAALAVVVFVLHAVSLCCWIRLVRQTTWLGVLAGAVATPLLVAWPAPFVPGWLIVAAVIYIPAAGLLLFVDVRLAMPTARRLRKMLFRIAVALVAVVAGVYVVREGCRELGLADRRHETVGRVLSACVADDCLIVEYVTGIERSNHTIREGTPHWAEIPLAFADEISCSMDREWGAADRQATPYEVHHRLLPGETARDARPVPVLTTYPEECEAHAPLTLYAAKESWRLVIAEPNAGPSRIAPMGLPSHPWAADCPAMNAVALNRRAEIAWVWQRIRDEVGMGSERKTRRRMAVNGLSLAKGTTIQFDPSGALRHGTLVGPQTVQGMTVQGQICLSESGRVTSAELVGPHDIDGLSVTKHVDMNGSGRLTAGTLAKDQSVRGHSLPDGTWLSLSPSGAIVRVMLPRATLIQGVRISGTADFHPSGRLRQCRLDSPQIVDGLQLAAGDIALWASGGIESATLVGRHVIQGIPAVRRVRFHESGRLRNGMLKERRWAL